MYLPMFFLSFEIFRSLKSSTSDAGETRESFYASTGPKDQKDKVEGYRQDYFNTEP
jgi:hypothetical protein